MAGVSFSNRAAGLDGWLENTTAALRTLATKVKRVGPVVLVLPAHLALIKQLKVPHLEPSKRHKIIRFQVEQAIPFTMSEVVWDSTRSGQNEVEVDMMLVAAKLEILEQLCVVSESAGFAPDRIIPSALATLAGYRLAQPDQTQPTLLLNLGARSTTLLLVEPNRFAARTVALGGDGINEQLAENQDCDPEAAERIKLSTRCEDLIRETRETLAARLDQEISRSVMHFNQQCGMMNPARIGLTGGGARLTGLKQILATRLKLPVEGLEPHTAVIFPAGSEPDLASTDLIGAAATVLLPFQPTMNLLPPRLRQRESRRRSQPWLIAAAVLAVATLLPPIMHYREVTATARANLTVLDGGLATLRARDARIRSDLNRLTLLKVEVEQLALIQARRTGWLQFFAGLQQRLIQVEDVWLDKLQTIPPADGLPMKLLVSGRMLDRSNPRAKVSPETFARVKALLTGIVGLPAISAVEGERFDSSQPGILKFDFVLVTDPARPL